MLRAVGSLETIVVEERTTPGARVALTIGASDSGGGSGIAADLKTFSVLDVFGTVAITAVTAQNTTAVKAISLLEPDLVRQQIEAVATDIGVHAVKCGLLPGGAMILQVAQAIKRFNLFPLVVDPVMVTTGGTMLMDEAAVPVLCAELLPLAAVATPNRTEAARMLGRNEPVEDLYTARSAASEICRRFDLRACIVTGIQRPNDEEGEAVDLYFDGTESRELISDWRPTGATHGAGTTFSAAITAGLATGQPIDEAIQTAKHLVSEAIRQTTDLGSGASPVNPLAYAKVK